jgi:hypothetical protein
MRLFCVVRAMLLMAMTIEGQQDRTPFRVGVAVDTADQTVTATCTQPEQAFLESKLEEYIVSLSRLFFNDQTLTLTEPLVEVSASHFSTQSFEDFNAYQAVKFNQATGNSIDLNLLDVLNSTNTTADPLTPSSDSNVTSTITTTEVTPSPTTPMPSDSLVPSAGPPVPSPSATNAITGSSAVTVTVTPMPTTPMPTRQPTSSSVTNTTSKTASPTLRPTTSPPTICSPVETCSTIDFDTFPNGTRSSRGAYVSDEWNATFGVTISVKPAGSDGYAPIKSGTNLSQARIFDTSNPVSSWYGGNAALGSPNKQCKAGGPGVGAGGGPGKTGENCAKLGNVLVIQQGNKYTPDSASSGGRFKFAFDSPVKVQSLGLLDISGFYTMGNITITKSDGSSSTFKYKALGSNSVQTVDIAVENVVKVMVYVTESAAITFLKFCKSSCSTSKKRILASHPDERLTLPIQTPGVPTTDDSNQQRKLAIVLFRWGGTSSMRCLGCPADAKDARRLSLRNRRLQSGNATSFLISAFETTITFGLTLNMIWDYKAWLKSNGLTAGCLGGGNKLKVVFELDLKAPLTY